MRFVCSSLLALTLTLVGAVQTLSAAQQHALTVYGEAPRYPADFRHFDYVNPDAPKGGSLRRSAIEIGQFDHLMPFIDKGMGVSQINGMLYAPLATRSMDEPYTVYGLVAEKMERGTDGLSLRFYLNPKARFADGTPITANDVKYTYELLMTQATCNTAPSSRRSKAWKSNRRRRSASISNTATAAPCPSISPRCRFFPNTGGKPAILPAARGLKYRRAAALTRSAMSTRAAPSPSSATQTGGAKTCQSVKACTTSINSALNILATSTWHVRSSRAAPTTTTANFQPPVIRSATTARRSATVACKKHNWQQAPCKARKALSST